MNHTYTIEGMTCMSCVAKVSSALSALPQVTNIAVDKITDTADIEMTESVALSEFQAALKKLDPKYSISSDSTEARETTSWFTAYKPILLIFFYILLVTSVIQFLGRSFDLSVWMRHFMAGFFLVFSFFKLLDLSGFANSYVTYDIIAKRWRSWGYLYAFIELGLGISYLLNCCPLATNIIAFTVMTVSIIGVLLSVLNKRKIQCACLGAVFDLPMSTVTIIEDALMILMSGYMILNFI